MKMAAEEGKSAAKRREQTVGLRAGLHLHTLVIHRSLVLQLPALRKNFTAQRSGFFFFFFFFFKGFKVAKTGGNAEVFCFCRSAVNYIIISEHLST